MKRLSLAGTDLHHYHICTFFNSRDEEYDVLTPFFKEGARQGEKNIHIVNPAELDSHRERLTRGGLNTHECEACGQLEVMGWHEAYLDETGTFDKDRMLATVRYLTGPGLDPKFGRVRVMGNMGWVFDGATKGAEAILEYETEVNDILAQAKQPAVCVYDVAKLSGAMMMDLLRSHPLTLINGVVQENPFYTPPAELLAELRARKAA